MMSLTIKENNGIFLLEGIIDSTTLKKLHNHLEFLLAYTKSVTINIDKVTAINKSGLEIIENLFRRAELNNKEFYVIGYGCKAIYESKNLLNVA